MWIQENCVANVYGFEPDPRLYPKLPSLPNVLFYPLAVAGTSELLKLRLGNTRNSSFRFSEHPDQEYLLVASVMLDKFCQDNSISHVDLIKLDVEGAEIEILKNIQDGFLETVGQITVEFHDFLDKKEISSIKEIVRKMKRFGFTCIKFSYFDYSDVLLINKRIYPISIMELFLLYGYKYFHGLSRMVHRYFRIRLSNVGN